MPLKGENSGIHNVPSLFGLASHGKRLGPGISYSTNTIFAASSLYGGYGATSLYLGRSAGDRGIALPSPKIELIYSEMSAAFWSVNPFHVAKYVMSRM